MQNLRWKLATVLLVVFVFGALGVYPIVASRYGARWPSALKPALLTEKQLKLGLDLKGGVHLVLRVQTDDALRSETDAAAEHLADELKTKNISFTSSVAIGPTQFRMDGIRPDQDGLFRTAAQDVPDVQADFDRSPGANGSYTFTMKQNAQVRLREEAVVGARQTIERRMDELNVTEPSISQQGADQLLVQLPGVANVDQAKEIIGRTGTLDLKIVEQGPSPTKEALMTNGQVPQGMEIVPGQTGSPGDASVVYYLLRHSPIVTGTEVRSARTNHDENNQPCVNFTLSNEGGRKFAKATSENIGRQLAIVLEGRVKSAPRIESRIQTEGRITGSFTEEEVKDLALVLRTGPLRASLTYLQERTIGPSLGADSIRSGVTASVVGLLVVVAFMLIYYKLSGVNAVIALISNLLILLGLMAYFGTVMTLPGIAGFVLTMGIGVDSNVLIFERIKEELEANRGVRAAINAGFNRVFWTLVDTHVAALISAAFLFQFGTGPIRGFALTLSIGLASNLFTSIFVSKTLFELELAQRRQVTTLSI